MSRIDQLSIQGIRNFAPETPEIIKFEPPVTLILGKNGSGKTTIIESLKYATTGEMPAGTGKGQNFVHDPKLTTKKMSIGKVQLKFQDEQNNSYIVARSMEARLLKSKMDFKSLDGTISIQQPDGSYINHKNKVKDLNTFVCNTLGVSHALLNNVLFCHQEDSNWPLDEARKVKEKFDDIFNTTRYVKCQDDIRKQVVEVKAKMKDIERMVDNYKMRKDQADEFRQDARRLAERRSALDADMSKLEREKAELEVKVKEGYDKHRAAEKVRADIQAKRLRQEELERNRHDLESDITRIISASIEELEREIEKFQLSKDQRQKEMNSLIEEHRQLDKLCAGNAVAQQEKLVHLGKLQSEEEQHRKRIRERDSLLSDLAQCFSWPNHSSCANEPLSEERVSQYHGLLRAEIERVKQEEANFRLQLEEEEKGLLDALNKLREDRVRLEQNIKTKESTLSDHMRELSGIEAKLGAMEANTRELNTLERQQAEALNQVQLAEREVNITELMEEISRAKSEKTEREREVDQVRQQLKKVMGQRDVRLKLDMLQKELTSKHTAERRLMSREKVEEAIKVLIEPGTNPDSLASYFNARLAAVSTSFATHQKRLVSLGREAATVDADLRNVRKSLEGKQAELEAHQQKLKNAGGTKPAEIETDITRLVQDLEDLEDKRGSVHGSGKVYNRLIEKMEAEKRKNAKDVACPLCHRAFEEAEETEELLRELKEMVEAMPAQKADYDRRITEKKEHHEQLLQLRPVALSAAKLAETEIPQLRTEIDRLEERSAAIKNELKETERTAEVFRNQEDVGKKAQADIIQLDALKSDIKKLQTQIESIKTQLNASGSGGAEEDSVEAVQERVEQAEGALRRAAERIETLNDRLNKHQARLAGLKQTANQLMERKLRISDGLQQRGNLTERKSTLEDLIDMVRADVEEGKMDLEPLIVKQMAAQTAHSDAQKKRNMLLEQARNKVEELQSQKRQMDSIEAELQRWISQGKETELKQSQAEVDRLAKEKAELETRKKSVATKVNSMQLALSNFENEERNLRNNLKLIVNTTDRRVVAEELERLGRELESYKVQQLVRDIKLQEGQLEACKDRLGELKGTHQEIANGIRELEAKLKRDEYATAEARWLEQVQDFEIHQAVSEDLSSFYNALECALMKFHKERMAVINKMVKEMWHSTYKGKDIDYVEVRADESAATGNSRRQYNYRVVMVKSGVEMDMRGRCSAGQKVLASLIIRMALANAFSAKCGVLALDEPTTNLDEDNIASLSETILDLASSITRQKRKFQLIIITHDEKFLERMSRDKRMEKYYRVDRSRKTNASEIRQYDVMSGLQSKKK